MCLIVCYYKLIIQPFWTVVKLFFTILNGKTTAAAAGTLGVWICY